MKRTKTMVLAGLLAGSTALSGCGLGESEESVADVEAGSIDSTALEGVEVTVGSKDFDEQLLLGQITLLSLKAAGADVTDKTDIEGSTATRQALLGGNIDVYWDYNGTGWINYLGHDKPIFDPVEQYEAVKEEDLAKNGLVWGPQAPFNNTYAFAVTQEFGEENGITTHSDMAAYLEENPDAVICIESEFASRPDGYPGFQRAYGITEGNVKQVGTGVVYTQLDKGNCDFGEVFTTDGRIGALGLVALEDDKSFFPLYNGVAIVREETNEQHPEILEVLTPVAEVLTTEVMQEMNTRVSADGEDPAVVAEDFLTGQGFIS